jgi:ABC-type lipoprotein export system ATPase subunit
VLVVDDITVELGGRVVLESISLQTEAGRAVALTGPSGSGKSVLLHTLAGLVELQSGRVLLDGQPVQSAGTSGAERVGLVLQTHGLASGLTAEENVALPLQVRGLERDDIAARCADALAAVGLSDVATRLVDTLSGGQRQRVGVARALAGQPDLMLADEPTAELDPVSRELVLTALFQPASPRIVVIASNDPEIVAACPQVIHLLDGRAVAPTP